MEDLPVMQEQEIPEIQVIQELLGQVDLEEMVVAERLEVLVDLEEILEVIQEVLEHRDHFLL